MAVKILMLTVFFAIMIAVGIYCRRHTTDVGGFVLGGRNVGPWLTAFAYGTSYFSAVIFVGYAGQFGWKFGIASTWIGIGNAVLGSLLAWIVLGRRTRLMTQHLHSSTMPDFFGRRYNSSALKIVASVIVFIFLIPYTASLYNGLSRLFSMAFPGIDYTVCVIVMAVLTGVYVIAGGYMATAINDFIQGIIMIGGIIAVIAAVLGKNGGFMGSLEGLSKISDPSVSRFDGVFNSFFGPDPLGLLFVIILTSLGTWGLPQMVQKFYAIESEKSISKGTVISTLFAVIVAGGCYFLGGFGRLFSDVVEHSASGAVVYDSIIPKMLEGLPDILIGIVIILVLSASMSTLSSLVLASSSTLTLDLIAEKKKNMSDNSKILCMRVFIVIFIAISAVIAVVQVKFNIIFIAQMMGISWGALAGSFLAPFIYGLYLKRTSRASVWVSFIFGSGLMVLNMLFKSAFPTILQSPINCGVVAMVAGLVIVPVVSLFTKPCDKADVDEIFTCYDKKVTVSAKKALD